MLWNTQAPRAVQEVIGQLSLSGRLEYESTCKVLLQFLEGDHDGPMKGDTRASKQFKADGTETTVSTGSEPGYLKRFVNASWNNGQSEYLPIYVPFITRIAQLQATLFHRPPTMRPRRGNEEVQGEEAKRCLELLAKVGFSERGKLAQQKAATVRVMFACPRYYRGKMYLDLIEPHELYVVEDPLNPGVLEDALAIGHRLPETADTVSVQRNRWLIWTRETIEGQDAWRVYYVDDDGRDLPNPYFPGNINPYGRFPHVRLTNAYHDKIFPTLDDALLNAQVAVNLAWTHIMSLIRRAGGTPFFAGFFDTERPLSMIFSENHPVIAKNPESKFDWVEIKADLNQLIGAITQYAKVQAALRGLPTEAMDVDAGRAIDALSAASKAMDRLDLVEVRQDQEGIWQENIQALWQSLVMVWNRAALPKDEIDPAIYIEVVWAQPELPVNRMEQAQASQTEIALGITSAVDVIMTRDKCSREEAQATFEANLRLRDMAKEDDAGKPQDMNEESESQDSDIRTEDRQ